MPTPLQATLDSAALKRMSSIAPSHFLELWFSCNASHTANILSRTYTHTNLSLEIRRRAYHPRFPGTSDSSHHQFLTNRIWTNYIQQTLFFSVPCGWTSQRWSLYHRWAAVDKSKFFHFEFVKIERGWLIGWKLQIAFAVVLIRVGVAGRAETTHGGKIGR